MKTLVDKIVMFVVILVVLTVLGSLVYNVALVFSYDKPCLEEIGKDFCDEYHLMFRGVDRLSPPTFFCADNERINGRNEFKFLPDELKGCKK